MQQASELQGGGLIEGEFEKNSKLKRKCKAENGRAIKKKARLCEVKFRPEAATVITLPT